MTGARLYRHESPIGAFLDKRRGKRDEKIKEEKEKTRATETLAGTLHLLAGYFNNNSGSHKITVLFYV